MSFAVLRIKEIKHRVKNRDLNWTFVDYFAKYNLNKKNKKKLHFPEDNNKKIQTWEKRNLNLKKIQ